MLQHTACGKIKYMYLLIIFNHEAQIWIQELPVWWKRQLPQWLQNEKISEQTYKQQNNVNIVKPYLSQSLHELIYHPWSRIKICGIDDLLYRKKALPCFLRQRKISAQHFLLPMKKKHFEIDNKQPSLEFMCLMIHYYIAHTYRA